MHESFDLILLTVQTKLATAGLLKDGDIICHICDESVYAVCDALRLLDAYACEVTKAIFHDDTVMTHLLACFQAACPC